MGQTLLVMGSLAVLSLMVLRANEIILDRTSGTYDAEATTVGIALAESKLDYATRLAYDQKAVSQRIYDASKFTAPASLGPETGETNPSLFNDIDDFNGYSATIATPPLDSFTVSYAVQYVSESNPDNVSSTQTFYKRMSITVANPSMSIPVTLSRLFVYRRYQ